MTGGSARARLVAGFVLLFLVAGAWWALSAAADCSQLGDDRCEGDEIRGLGLVGMYVALVGLPGAAVLIFSGIRRSWPTHRWNSVVWLLIFLVLVAAGILLGGWAGITLVWGIAEGGLLSAWGAIGLMSAVVAYAFGRGALVIVRTVLAPATRDRASATPRRARQPSPSTPPHGAGSSLRAPLDRSTIPWVLAAVSVLGVLAAVPLGAGALLFAFGMATVALLVANLHRFADEGAAVRMLKLSAVLLATAFALHAVAVAMAASTSCPPSANSSWGFSDRVSEWPAGVRCMDPERGTYVHQPHAWLTWTVALTAVAGFGVLFLTSFGYGRDRSPP